MLSNRCPECNFKSLKYLGAFAECNNCGHVIKNLSFWQRYLAWAIGKNWWIRALILAYFGYMFIDLIQDPTLSQPNIFFLGLELLNFGIHELGHILFIPFGEFMRIAGGSLFQLMFPLFWLVGFLQKKMLFAATMCIAWLGQNFYYVANYAADAKDRLLPLSVGPAGIGLQGDEAAYDRAHDWYQLLSRTGQLENTELIANIIRSLGVVSFVIALALGLVLITQMLRSRS